MDTKFHYNVVPSGNKVGARVAFQGELKQADIVSAAAAATGQTPEQIIAGGTAVISQVILGAQKSQRVRGLFGLLSLTPRCGGVHPDPDFQPTVENMNLAINATLSPEGLALFQEGITFERDAVLGEKVPEIDRVYDGASHSLNVCTPGGAFRLGGRDFGVEPDGSVLTLGVFLTPVAAGAAVRINSYSDWTGTEIMGSWPTGLVGAQRLSVVANYATGGSHRTGIYGTNLIP